MLKARAERSSSARLIWTSRPIPSTARLPEWLGWVGRTDQAAQIHAIGPEKKPAGPPAEEPTIARWRHRAGGSAIHMPRGTTSTSVRRQRSHRWNKRVRHFDGDEYELQDWMVALVSDELSYCGRIRLAPQWKAVINIRIGRSSSMRS